jgi:hypothetical protein
MNEFITKQSSRLLFSILTPGFFGILPYALTLYCNFNFCKNNWDSSLVLFVLFFFSLAFGLIFHLLGVKLELQIDRILTCCYCKKFDQVWEDYLSLELDKIENLRRKYMSFLIDRYQFQLNMCPASICNHWIFLFPTPPKLVTVAYYLFCSGWFCLGCFTLIP